MSLYSSKHNLQKRQKDHQQHYSSDLHQTNEKLVLPKLSPVERLQRTNVHQTPRDRLQSENLFKLFSDHNTVDILRHKNVGDFKHKQHKSSEDLPFLMRQIENQKDEIMKQMKIWTRIVESASKEQIHFTQRDFVQLHNTFFKWLFFIDESYGLYQKMANIVPLPLIHPHGGQEFVKKSPNLYHSKLQIEKQEHKQDIERLNFMVKQLEQQKQALKLEIESLKIQIEEPQKKEQLLQPIIHPNEKIKDNKKIVDLMGQSEQFLKMLKQDIIMGKNIRKYLSEIDERLLHLKQYKKLIHLH